MKEKLWATFEGKTSEQTGQVHIPRFPVFTLGMASSLCSCLCCVAAEFLVS